MEILEEDCVSIELRIFKKLMLEFFVKSAISIKLLLFRSRWKTFLGEGALPLKTDPSQSSSADTPIGCLPQCPWGLF
jgi:hypothetical protein